MDRENYQKRIDDLQNAVSSLLDANNAMGEKIQKLEKIADEYEDLKVRYEKLEGELAMSKPNMENSSSESPAKKERDNSNRPEHNEKGHH